VVLAVEPLVLVVLAVVLLVLVPLVGSGSTSGSASQLRRLRGKKGCPIRRLSSVGLTTVIGEAGQRCWI
jgi:hypothetical protein